MRDAASRGGMSGNRFFSLNQKTASPIGLQGCFFLEPFDASWILTGEKVLVAPYKKPERVLRS